MDGPLSNSNLLQVILDTLKPNTQAPRITSMEASLCKSSSKTSNRFSVNIRDYFWNLPLTCADYLWMVNFGCKSLSLPFVFNGTCEISFPSVIFCTVSNGTCEISFKSVIFALSLMGHVKFHLNLSFLHCIQWDMWNFISISHFLHCL